MTRIALVTSAAQPNLSDDDRLVLPHLAALGIDAVAVRWDDLTAKWGEFDGVVLRNLSDYHLRVAEFDEWLNALNDAGARVWNPTAVIRWNSEKRYLLELQKRGVPVVPTVIVSRDRVVDLPYVLRSNNWTKAVVKPAIATNGYNTWLTESTTALGDQRHLVSMMMHSDVLVQPFLSEIARDGEFAFVFFGGEYSHSFRKRPKPGDYRTGVDFGGRSTRFDAPDAWIDQAESMLAHLPQTMLYARLDCIMRENQLMLHELELIEPRPWPAL